ncbi:GNAT family N-acetyltransferase [Chitinophaga sp. Cy-1792]|uniref:GNAT family N-acetyltransferase n=1 Tax=Chitinophaga sp. Cy-1792 TaxID=2608339 RepID=UPI001422CF40|nr:GNAT family N-acetyltransferase [Chitinophaga sp. Cy-1792]NIG54057.1 GNAT family N-acetyltransferase [Chitinophaga sp. Cy-1792]
MEPIQIVPITTADVPTLQSIGRKIFFETFSPHTSEENMAQYLEEKFSIEQLTKEVNTPGSFFYFAQLENQVIGYLKLNTGTAQTEEQADSAYEIERIYVLSEYHGRKVGQILVEKALEIALQEQAPFVWLGVWEENHRALNFYRKNGFEPFDTHVFKLGEDIQTDIMMKKILA